MTVTLTTKPVTMFYENNKEGALLMPISNSILNILNMKDNFIIFSENFLEERI